MRAKALVLLALLAALAGIAFVRRGPPDPLSQASLDALLLSPIDPASPKPDAPRPPFWKALLEHNALTLGPAGPSLRLGRVLADPSAARISAEHAGELLALEAEGPDGKLGMPLWRAMLAGPSLEQGPAGRTLAFYGCRHTADADAAPVLEDTYRARVSLADALVQYALSEPGAAPLTLLGREAPVKGGVNFEVQLLGDTQSVSVSFDGHAAPPLKASRTYRPPPPNDARARAALSAALRERLADEGLGKLEVVGAEAPVEDGLDVRIELMGEHLALVATRAGGERLATHRAFPERNRSPD